MEKVIDKELINHLQKLETTQQEMVLSYVKDLLTSEEMNRRADVSEKAIVSGQVKTIDQFNANFENWKREMKLSLQNC